MPAITWGELTEVIKALASLAWPILVLILVQARERPPGRGREMSREVPRVWGANLCGPVLPRMPVVSEAH